MFEFDKYDPTRHHHRSLPDLPYRPFTAARRRAFLLWGEHCTECAAPDCFATCSLYDPRSDQRCRRFEYGAFRNSAFTSSSGPGAEIVFKRWGKLEARGNATMLRPRTVRNLERAATLLAPPLNAIGRVAARVTRDLRWSYLTHSLLERLNSQIQRRRRPGYDPDAFVIEIYNPGMNEVALHLAVAVDRTKLPPSLEPGQIPNPVFERLIVPSGYFRLDLPGSRFEALLSSDFPFGITITPGPVDGAHLVFLTLEFVQYEDAACEKPIVKDAPKAAKCVVFDLDNTLWEGVLLEGDVALRPGIEQTIRDLDQRGILISVASKNAADDAMKKLRAFGIEEFIVHPAIGWNSKSQSIADIARALNIGIDSIIFVDDNPFERDEVRQAFPAVETLSESELPYLLLHPRLRGDATAESRTRRHMYRQAAARTAVAESFGENYIEFLRSCETEVEIRPNSAEDADRIYELAQRTNQLNFSGRKYGWDELQPLLANPSLDRFVIKCADKYGSYGVVGFCLARRVHDVLRIDDLMLSCRVQGKFIEKALLHHLCMRPGWNVRRVQVAFKATERNAPARNVLRELGFEETDEGVLERDVAPDRFAVGDLIRIEGGYAPASPECSPKIPDSVSARS